MGIDEAGRGPALGSMMYACVYMAGKNIPRLKEVGMDDSKVLTAQKRDELMEWMDSQPYLGYYAQECTAEMLSNEMLLPNKNNLNNIAHCTTMDMIAHVCEVLGQTASHGPLRRVYVDTVGTPETYEQLLQRRFGHLNIRFKVSKKADSKYALVSAASILAKTFRDKVLADIESSLGTGEMGSGYPADPTTKLWLSTNVDKVFGYPNMVRFSWKTIDNCLLDHKCSIVIWEEQPDGHKARSNHNARSPFYRRRKISSIHQL